MAEHKTLRVLHGPGVGAGQPAIIAAAQRSLGLATEVVIDYEKVYRFRADHVLFDYSDPRRVKRQKVHAFLASHASRFDVFHLYARPYLLAPGLEFPSALDLLALRAMGKVLIFHYRGSEARTPSEFSRRSPHNYVQDDPRGALGRYDEARAAAYHAFIRTVCHRVLVPDPELQSYVPEASIVPRALDLDAWRYVGPRSSDLPLVVHAPSDRLIKGTEALLAAVSRLQEEGLRFRFELVENLDHAAARRKYEEADIVVDQLRIGWYGVLGVEAMALGKALVAYVREDLHPRFGAPWPLAQATPATLAEVLRRLIQSPAERERLGRAGRAFAEDVHDARRIAAGLAALYRDAAAAPNALDMARVLDYLSFQQDRHDAQLEALRNERPDRFFGRWAWRLMRSTLRRP